MPTITGYADALANLAIKAKSDQMNELLDQLLSYAKLGAPQYQMNLASADIAELLRLSCASLFGGMEHKWMELDLRLSDEPVLREVDVLDLKCAIGNLLTNAIRHNPEGTLLSVGLAEEPEHSAIQITGSAVLRT